MSRDAERRLAEAVAIALLVLVVATVLRAAGIV